MFWDPTMILLIPALIISLWAQAKVHSTFHKYLRVQAATRLSGAAVARNLLNANGAGHVRIEMTSGHLSDHYDPRSRTVRLSPDVFKGSSLAALGVAAHEAGHALQHEHGYFPLVLRNNFAPVAQFGSNLALPLLFIGLILGYANLAIWGIYLFAAVVIFQIITLPVEFNASQRAIALLETGGYLAKNEVQPTKRVLDAAALTYVAAAITAVLTLLRFIILARFFGREE
jgi:Zn-dependent membrane protease YugP